MKNVQMEWPRRQFIANLSGLGALLLATPDLSWAVDDIDPKIAAIVANIIGVDTHNHIDVPVNPMELPGPSVDLAGEMKKSGLSAICMTFALDYQRLVNPGDGYNRFITGLDAMDKLLASNNINRSLTLADLQKAHKQHQPTVIQSVEGGHFLEGRLERLAEAYNRGLRCLDLLHDNDASVPLGDIYTKPAQWGGLTSFGADVVKECNKLGILIDLTHGNNEMVNAALKLTTKPVVITHTGLDSQLGQNARMANMMRPRLISKEQAKIVADTGGVIGVWTHLADTSLEYAQNVRALVDIVGIDHVCIGTDTKLTPAYRSPGGPGPRPDGPGPQPGGNPSNETGGPPRGNTRQTGSGGGQNRERIGERTNKAWQDQQTGFLYTVVDALLKTGFTADEIGKIGGGNFCRVFDAATATHR